MRDCPISALRGTFAALLLVVCPDESGSEKVEMGRRGRCGVDMEKGRADEVGAVEECAEQISRVVDLSPPVPLISKR